MKMSDPDLLTHVRDVIRGEAAALTLAAECVDERYLTALRMLAGLKGKIVVLGVGKSGHIAKKLAATFSSTGSPAIFLHPTEARHGDLGLLQEGDAAIAIGKSGESEELLVLVPSIRKRRIPIIAITAAPQSTLALKADIVLDTGALKEICPFDLAPTASTTAALAIGDALALTLMKMKEFRPDDFADNHPGGKLGRRLLARIEDLMIPLAECPTLSLRAATIESVIARLSSNPLGIILFTEDQKTLEGILTDGDVRRLLSLHKAKIFDIPIADIVNRKPEVIDAALLAFDALKKMEERERPLNVLPVVKGGSLVGLVRVHELLKLG